MFSPKKKPNLTTGVGGELLVHGIPDDVDEDDFRRDAEEEWEEAGKDPSEFSMEAFAEYALKRDVKDKMVHHRLEDYRGRSHLIEKEEAMEKQKNRLSGAKVARTAVSMGSDVINTAGMIRRMIGNAIEPGHYKRQRTKRANLRRIAISDADAARLNQEKEAARQRKLDADERQKILEEERRARIGRDAPTSQLHHDLVTAAEQERKERDMEHFRERRRATTEARLREIELNQEKAAEEAESKNKSIREWRVGHWTKERKRLLDESHRRVKEAREQREEVRAAVEDADYGEKAQRQLDRARDQVLGPALSSDPSGGKLGVFGKSLDPGEFDAAAGGGTRSGVDDAEPHLFSAQPRTGYERRVVDAQDKRSDVERRQALYDALGRESKQVASEKEALVILRERLAAELQQHEVEHSELLQMQSGPPRRDPRPEERGETFMRKNRMKALREQIGSVDHKAGLLEERERAVQEQSMQEARALAGLREELREVEASLSEVNGGLGELPVVVGRHISKVPGGVGKDMGRPRETLENVTMASRLAVIEGSAETSLQAHRSARQLDHRIWTMEEQKKNAKMHYEDLLTSLADAANRVKQARADHLRADLVNALSLFFRSGKQLRVVNQRFAGSLSWWKLRARDSCEGGARWASNDEFSYMGKELLKEHEASQEGATALPPLEFDGTTETVDEDPKNQVQGVTIGPRGSAIIVGVFEFPKFDMFEVTVVVSKTFPFELEQGDPADRVNIKFGPDLKNLTHVATVFNVANEENGQFRHQVKFHLRSRTLAFKFEFQSSHFNMRHHLVVERGDYDQKELPPLDIQPGSNRVVSSYVKLLRIDEVSGAGQFSKLLAELIRAEEAEGCEIWDSSSFLGVPQRYKRLDFVKLMKRHLIKLKQREDAEAAKLQLRPGTEGFDQLDAQEQARILRLHKSQNDYLVRKRLRQQRTVDEAMQKVGMAIECFNKRLQRWEHANVIDCRIIWRDNGTRAEIRHKVQRVDDQQRALGRAKWENLKNLRHYEAKESEMDEEALKSWKMNEAARARLIAEQQEAERQRKAVTDERRRKRDSDQHRFDEERERAVLARKAEAQIAAKRELRTKQVKSSIRTNRKRLVEEWKVGIGTPSGGPEALALSKAHAMAKAQWLEEYIQAAVDEEQEDWEERDEDRREDMRKEDIKIAREEVRQAEVAAREKALREVELNKLRIRRRMETRQRLMIPLAKFQLAVPRPRFCEHVHCKSWGDCYGKGLRCVDCGKEILLTHEEESQQRGVGSGDDPELIEAIDRHRRNEANFRFRRAEELISVERERRRIEKERWELVQSDPNFYDFEDIRAVYEFDRRHQYIFRREGRIRQGVQWRQDDLNRFLDGRREAFREMSPKSRKRAEHELDSWLQDHMPPPFRREEMMHHAQFRDSIHTFARIMNYRSRIWDLRSRRKDLEIMVYVDSEVLSYLHEQIWALEIRLKHVEIDMRSASEVLLIRKLAALQYADLREILNLADQDKREKEMMNAGKADLAEEWEQMAREVRKTMMNLLRQRVYYQRKMEGVQERVRFARTRADSGLIQVQSAQRKVDSIHYRRRGTIVPTPFGHCQVLMFREEDETVIVRLPNKHLQVRMYVPLDVCMQMEIEVAERTRVAMEADEANCKAFYKWEQGLRRREVVCMMEEEKTLKDQLAFEREIAADEAMVGHKVHFAIEDAKQFIRTPLGVEEIKRRVEKALDGEKKRIDREMRAWSGTGKRPKKLTGFQQAVFRSRQKRPFAKAFVAEQATLAETEARNAIERKHQNRAEEAAFDFVFRGFLEEFITEVADNGLRSGLEAKERAEAETGVVFPRPAHMQYTVYSTLSSWWMGKKKQLQKDLERWGARSAQDELRWEQERQQRNKLMRDVELREAKEREKERQQTVCREMFEEEVFVRKFYRDEMRQNLEERRAMKTAETEMRFYLRELEAYEAMAASKYRVGGASDFGLDGEGTGPTSRELRRLELKKGTADRARMQREIALMEWEDELAQAVRTELKQQEQQEALRREMQMYGLGGEEDGEAEEDIDSDFDSGDDEEEDYLDGESDEVKAEVAAMTPEEKKTWRRGQRRKRRLERQKARAEAKRAAMEKEAADAIERAALRFRIDHAKAELEWMEHEEEAKLAEREMRVSAENVRKVTLYCQMKGQEELRVRSRARTYRDDADKYGKLVRDARKWHGECTDEADRARRVKFRVDADTAYTDTSAICGFHQRYMTEKLFQRLRYAYFETIARIVANRAEVVATERGLMRMSEELVRNEIENKHKTKALADLWKERKRDEFLRTRRSELRKVMFNKWSGSLIKVAFQGWVRFWTWHQGMRGAFNLKYEIIKQKLDLKRLRPETQEAVDRKEHVVAMAAEGGNGGNTPAAQHEPRKTLMQRHTERPVRCRLCKKFFLEGQNHDQACAYHPGEYKTCCPSWCDGLSTQCMSHRTPRWTCCDVRDKGKFGSSGCARRFHLAPRVDEQYQKAIQGKEEAFIHQVSHMSEDLQRIREENWEAQARKVKMDQLDGMGKEVEAQRKIVRKFDDLKLGDEDMNRFRVNPVTGEVEDNV